MIMEYKVLNSVGTFNAEKELNKLAEERWRVIAISIEPPLSHSSSTYLIVVLEREKQINPSLRKEK